MVPVAIGLRAGRGGSVVVAVTFDGRLPRVVLSEFLATTSENDRLSLEPYHVAAEMAQGTQGEVPAEVAAAVAKGRKRQDEMAAKGLAALTEKLKEAQYELVVAALLVNRAGWITDLLQHSLSAPEHPPVAEGLAVRDALRFALGGCGVRTVEMDEKSLLHAGEVELRLLSSEISLQLDSLGARVGRPWRKEQKLACLSAWIALVAT